MTMHRTIFAACAALHGLTAAVLGQITGPSSSQSPYLLPAPGAAGVQTVSLLTVGDSIGGYRLAGIPDGMGAYKRVPEGRSFGLLVSHELFVDTGATHAHGQRGSFVSFWGINPADKSVFLGRDHIQTVVTTGSQALNRLCSGDMPERVAFWPDATPSSDEPYIYLSGEEVGAFGRAFAHVVSGPEQRVSYDLPSLGKFSWENALARPYASPWTVVVGIDDASPGQVYVYIGEKRSTGGLLERTGLTGGTLYGVKVPGVPFEDRATGLFGQTRFELSNLGDVSSQSGVQLQAASFAAGVTEFLRPEDGCWDPRHPRDFYFVTTDRFDTVLTPGRSRLWRLRFDDVDRPELGGDIEALLDGTEGHQMLDNLCIDRRGHLLMQEDPGGNPHLARVWQYTLATDSLKLLAAHDPARFLAGGASFLTQDEESSGIFDASRFLGGGWFLLNVQAHVAHPDPDLVEHGQLLALFNPDSQ